MFAENLIAPTMASNDDISRKIGDLERMLERVLYGQAQLHLRMKFPSSEEVFTTADIKEEQDRMLKDFQNRYSQGVEEEQKFKRSRPPYQQD
jgi:hypothetical protein